MSRGRTGEDSIRSARVRELVCRTCRRTQCELLISEGGTVDTGVDLNVSTTPAQRPGRTMGLTGLEAPLARLCSSGLVFEGMGSTVSTDNHASRPIAFWRGEMSVDGFEGTHADFSAFTFGTSRHSILTVPYKMFGGARTFAGYKYGIEDYKGTSSTRTSATGLHLLSQRRSQWSIEGRFHSDLLERAIRRKGRAESTSSRRVPRVVSPADEHLIPHNTTIHDLKAIQVSNIIARGLELGLTR
jgi:hypothetical protein